MVVVQRASSLVGERYVIFNVIHAEVITYCTRLFCMQNKIKEVSMEISHPTMTSKLTIRKIPSQCSQVTFFVKERKSCPEVYSFQLINVLF